MGKPEPLGRFCQLLYCILELLPLLLREVANLLSAGDGGAGTLNASGMLALTPLAAVGKDVPKLVGLSIETTAQVSPQSTSLQRLPRENFTTW